MFKENAQQMETALQRIRELKMAAAQGGPQKNREKHVARGKMLAKE
jgi:acetyl-CoA carboxylase carboxyltransferase component